MDETLPRTETRLTISVATIDLPIDDQDRQAVLDELGDHVGSWLDEHSDVESDASISVTTGQQYSQVSAVCPRCGEPLEVHGIHMDDENGAFAVAVCNGTNCDWSGDAVYRIIDLEGSEGDAYESAVGAGDVIPSYHQY